MHRDSTPSPPMKPKVNLWIEIGNQVALSRWRIELLSAIADTGSISGAAERMGVPYRRAWDKIHEMEERLGLALLDTQTGGFGGGGARLTPAAKDYIARFRHFSEGIDLYVQQHFEEAFGSSEASERHQGAG
jgi:molybdate transport system regulatory protein